LRYDSVNESAGLFGLTDMRDFCAVHLFPNGSIGPGFMGEVGHGLVSGTESMLDGFNLIEERTP
jgi:hypothetical protein